MSFLLRLRIYPPIYQKWKGREVKAKALNWGPRLGPSRTHPKDSMVREVERTAPCLCGSDGAPTPNTIALNKIV